MKKRWIAVLLTACLSISLFSGCNGNSTFSQLGSGQNGSDQSGNGANQGNEAGEGENGSDKDEGPKRKIVTDEESMERLFGQYDHDALMPFLDNISENYNFPVIHITTVDDKEILEKEYVSAIVDVANCDEKYCISAAGGVKVRGNSSAQDKEKPYRIKFEEKQPMLGLHDGESFRSWVLLKPYWNLCPDMTAFALARYLYGDRYYASDCTFAHVYINGMYRGLYQVCEQNESVKGRVDVTEPKDKEPGNSIGYFLEIDNYPDSDHPFFDMDYMNAKVTDIAGTTRAFDGVQVSVHSDITTDEQLKFIDKYMNNVFKIAYNGIEKNKIMGFNDKYEAVDASKEYASVEEALEAIMDLDSMVDTLILEELVHNYDLGEGSFYMAVDFSEDAKYDRLTFLAPWDYNWAFGDAADGGYYASTFQPMAADFDRSGVWFILLMKADWFRDRVTARWKELTSQGFPYNVTNELREYLEPLRNDLGDEFWKVDTGISLLEFVEGRSVYLNRMWK